MAFCSNCGHPLTGREKFCAECGTSVQNGTASAAASSGPSPIAPPSSAPTAATAPAAYAPVGVPVAVPPPPIQPAQQKKGMMGTVVIIVVVAGLGYYLYTRSHARPAPAPAPAPVPAAQTPPPGSNGNGSPEAEAALVNEQSFNAHWEDQSGMLVLTTATWANNSDTNIASATVQCRQFNNAGTDLSEYRVNLDGPTKAQTSSEFSNVSLGATATGMTKVDCSIIHVKPAS